METHIQKARQRHKARAREGERGRDREREQRCSSEYYICVVVRHLCSRNEEVRGEVGWGGGVGRGRWW